MKIMIVGAGKVGYKLAEVLSNTENSITIVDNNVQALERVNENLDVLVYKANGVQVDALKNLNVESYDLAIAVTDSDETNIIVSSLSKKLGCNKVIARVRDPEYAQQRDFIKSVMEIDYIINPELATAKEIIRYLLSSYSFYTENFADGRIVMVDFNANDLGGFIGKKLKDLKNMDDLLIAAIYRNGSMIIPHGESMIIEDDVLYMIGKKEKINQLAKNNKLSIQEKYVRKVMILGGSKIGYYLAEKLSAMGIFVKIIEQDEERCEYLSDNLNSTLVVCGDCSDINFLEEEDISMMDAVIGVTGFDEENLLLTLMAKQLGVRKVIAKVSKPSYAKIIEKLGVDVALNPVDITASEILKFIRGGRAASVSFLLGGQAEVTEVIADESMGIVGKKIAEMRLPKGIIIGAIAHKDKVIIPKGDMVIHTGDRFVVFCHSSEMHVLETIFKVKKGGSI